LRFGLSDWLFYMTKVVALPVAPADVPDPIESLIQSGFAVVGTPDDAIAQISRLQEQTGGFGCFMQLAHNWASWENTKHSYELFARYVIPKFQQLNIRRDASLEWARVNHDEFIGRARSAVSARVARHIEEKGTDNISPEILKNYTGA
jgi:limonene 1,2-monooxygenase